MFSRKRGIKSLSSASHLFDKLMMFDELLGTDNRMLARKNGVVLADERGGLSRAEVRLLLRTAKQMRSEMNLLPTLMEKAVNCGEEGGRSSWMVLIAKGDNLLLTVVRALQGIKLD